ncbi:hypothetical protein BCU90_07615 [Vibrio lentus]|uniref:lipopolysaccharide biosynthesis protein n=1 Tax=Vibrio TaxID=662 RepID=UPI000C82A847|nr:MULTISPECIES: oligosaccharide flippase family protein [Vibrio]MDN2667521.1 oligosaccharide flippase family protein [Vibrio sp. 14N.309.X.WAT.E.F5]PMG48445.1 hypothetical protein BCU90_07615 [Vibrio lentus]
MKFKYNVISSYLSKFINTILVLVCAPVYISIIGIESYGIISVYMLIQTLMVVLDAGISSTFTRQVALSVDDKNKSELVSIHLKAIFIVFFVICLVISTVSLIFPSGLVSVIFPDNNEIDKSVLYDSASLIGLVVGLRWLSGPLKSIYIGCQYLVRLNTINIVVSITKYVGVIPLLYVSDNALIHYFTFQLFLSLVEFIVLLLGANKLFPFINRKLSLNRLKEGKRIYTFAVTVALSSWLWIGISQIDKILLTKYLSLKEFAYFTLAATLFNSMYLLITPAAQAILPKLALSYGKNINSYYKVFDDVVLKVYAFVAPVSIFILLYSNEIIYIWLENSLIIDGSNRYIIFYLLATILMLVVNSFYYLQHSQGDLKLHNTFHLFLFLFFVFCMYFGIESYGVLGASVSWLLGAFIYLFLGGVIVFRKHHNRSFYSWLFRYIIPPFFISTAIISLVRGLVGFEFIYDEGERLHNLLVLTCHSLFAFFPIVGLYYFYLMFINSNSIKDRL